MPTPKSAARIALDELLADGQWHDRADAIEHMAPYVPPGQAIRRAIGLRERQDAERRRQGVTPNPSQSRARDSQAVGAHDIARATVNGAADNGAIESISAPDGRVLIRRTPSA